MTETLPAEIQDHVDRARHLEAEAKQMLLDSTEMKRSVARTLSEAGWIQKDIAEVLGVSHQRISQLLAPRSLL